MNRMHGSIIAGLGLWLVGCAALAPRATSSPTPTSTLPMPTATLTPSPAASPEPTATRPAPSPSPSPSPTPTPKAESRPITLSVVYDNNAYDARLQTDWGFGCFIEGLEETILFDTGGNSALLLRNMRALGLTPQVVDVVVLSHVHADHTGGLQGFLAENPNVTVYMPVSFPENLKATVRSAGATLVEVSGPTPVGAHAFSTGEMGQHIREQALALETAEGLVVVTGCAHPGVVLLTEQALDYHGGEVELVLGGFHLKDANTAQIEQTIAGLRGIGVRRVAPTHCTGDAARQAFADAFGENYTRTGVGQVFTVFGAE